MPSTRLPSNDASDNDIVGLGATLLDLVGAPSVIAAQQALLLLFLLLLLLRELGVGVPPRLRRVLLDPRQVARDGEAAQREHDQAAEGDRLAEADGRQRWRPEQRADRLPRDAERLPVDPWLAPFLRTF